jgi:hypothetical protein
LWFFLFEEELVETDSGENIEDEMTVGAKEEGGEGTRGGRAVDGAREGVNIAFLDKEGEVLSTSDSDSEDGALKEE